MTRPALLLLLLCLRISHDAALLVEGFTLLPILPTKPRSLPPSSLSASPELEDNWNPRTESMSRRKLITFISGIGTVATAATLAQAAPPIAIIAEELGYFPVTSKSGNMVYVPQRVQRTSSQQAIQLAQKLSQAGAVMYGAYWCPHCARQKELLGREAWNYITYVECSPPGNAAQPQMCLQKKVDGYPTWIFPDKTLLGGERSLEELAQKVDFAFQPDLEQNLPPPVGFNNACNN